MALTSETLAGHLRSVDDLEPPPGEGRTAEVHRRARRMRRHRLSVGTLAAVVVLAAAAGIVTVLRTPESVTHLATEHDLPTSMRQPDGVVYRIAAVVTMDTREQQSVTVRVPAPYGMVTVAGTCDSSGDHNAVASDDVTLSSPGVQSTTSFFCGAHVGPSDLEVGPPGADGRATVMITDQDLIRQEAVTWTFGIYTWQLPPKLTPLAPLPDLPGTLDGYTLRQTVSGTLATQRSVNVHVPAGTAWEVVPICGPALRNAPDGLSAWQIDDVKISVPGQVVVSVDGAPQTAEPCNIVASVGDLAGASAGPGLSRIYPPQVSDATVTFEFPRAYDLRAATWALGIYEKN